MRVAAYARVSNDSQVEQYSLDAQRNAIEQYAARSGWAVGEYFVDAGVSAFTDDPEARPAFSRLMAGVDAGHWQMVLVARLDRFARSIIVAVSQLKRLRAADCALVDIASQIDYSSSTGQFVFGIQSLIAENESRLISERTLAGIAQKKREGKHVGGIPWGAVRDDSAHLRVDPATAPTLDRLLTLAATHSFGQVAAALNAAGIPSPRGKAWEPPVVHKIIRIGAWLLDQPEPWPAKWSAALSRPRPPASNWNKNPKMLTGILRCACGGIIVNCTTIVRPNGLVYLPVQCRHYTQERPIGTHCPYRKTGRGAYEAAFTRWLQALPDLRGASPATRDVGAALVAIRGRREIAGALLDGASIQLPEYRRRIAMLDAEEATLRVPATSPEALAETVLVTQRVWGTASPADQNALARRLIARIVIAGRVMTVEPVPELRALLDEKGWDEYVIGA